jgi:AraC family transcriptional regulator, arabinose operon regulatory protein
LKPIIVQLSSYSKHPEPFRHQFTNGLDTYVIRLQAVGISQALIDGEYVDVSPGDLLLFKPGDRYDLRIGTPGEPMKANGDYFVLCTGSGMDKWWEQKRRPTKIKIAEDGKITAQWHQLIAEKRRLDGGNPKLVTLLVRSLLLMLDRAIEEAPMAQSIPGFHALRIRNYVEEHAARPFRLEDVASHCGLSVSRAVHLFKEHFGDSIMGYVLRIRMAHALDLLHHSALSLEQIAAETGLGSYAYFHRVFRAQYGMSPGAYRKEQIQLERHKAHTEK